MLIDAHHHLESRPDYMDELLAASQELKIDKVCLFGAGRQHLQYGLADNVGSASDRPGVLGIDCGEWEEGVIFPSYQIRKLVTDESLSEGSEIVHSGLWRVLEGKI